MPHIHPQPDPATTSDVRLYWAVAVNVLLTVAQIVGGVASGSLSLVADALHNLSDAASLLLALIARKIGRRPPDRDHTFGHRRAELVGALINLTSLILVGLYLVYEALGRLFDEQVINGWIVIIVAVVALVVDLVTAGLMYAHSRDNLNMKAAFVHNLSDALASVGVIVAGALILLYEWYWVDLAVTLLISGYIIWQGVTMMGETIRILMDSVPAGLDLDELVAAMQSVPYVRGVHHLHVRQVDEHHRGLECHVVIDPRALHAYTDTKHRLKEVLRERFGIDDATLEFDVGEPDESDHNTELIAERG